MISKHQLEVLETLWREGRCLTKGEIIDLSTDRSWKKSMAHNLLNGLLEKQYIRVTGTQLTGKVYARLYEASISKEDYFSTNMDVIMPSMDLPEASLPEAFMALTAGKRVSPKTLDRLRSIMSELEDGSSEE